MDDKQNQSLLSRRGTGSGWPIILMVGLSVLFFLRGPDFVWKMWDHLADPGDAVFTSWLLAWDNHAVLTPGASLWDAPILFPAKNTFALSENMVGNLPISLPVYLLTGNPTLAANCVLIFAFIFSALAVFLLVRRLTGSTLAGLVSGILFSFNPYRWEHACHLQLLPFYWSVFALYFAHAYLTSQKARHWIWMLVMVVGQYYACIYNGTMLAIFLSTMLAVFLLSLAVQRGPDRQTLSLGRLAILVVLSLPLLALILWPLAGPYLRASADWGMVRTLAENKMFSVNPFGFILPARAFSHYDFLRSNVPMYGTPEGLVFLGITPWLLAFVGVAFLLRRGTRKVGDTTHDPAAGPSNVESGSPFSSVDLRIGRIYILLALFMMVLMMGPYIQLDDPVVNLRIPGVASFTGENVDLRVNLPFRYLYAVVPGAKALRVPARFAQFLLLALVVVAGFGVARLERRLKTRRRVYAWVIGLGFLILLLYDYQVSAGFATYSPPPAQFPAVYRYLNQSPKKVLLELPFGVGGRPESWHSYRYLHYQTAHWRPKVDGLTSFLPEGLGTLSEKTGGAPSDEALRLIAATPAETVVIHLDYYRPEHRAGWETADLRPFGFSFAGRFEDAVVWERSGGPAGQPGLALSQVIVLVRGQERHLLLCARRSDEARPWLFLGEPMGQLTVTGTDKAGVSVESEGRIRIPAYVPADSPLIVMPGKLPAELDTIRSITFRHRLLGERKIDGSKVAVLPFEKTSASDVSGLAARIEAAPVDQLRSPFVAGRALRVQWRVQNTGKAVWLPVGVGDGNSCLDKYGVVYLAISWYPAEGIPEGAPQSGAVKRQVVPVSKLLLPGEETTVATEIEPPAEPGRYLLAADMLSQCVCWFGAVSPGQAVVQHVEVRP